MTTPSRTDRQGNPDSMMAAEFNRLNPMPTAEPGLSAETIEEWREWWHNMPYKDGEIAQVNQICDAALSSLRGTFADGIEAAAKVFLQHYAVTQDQADFANAILRGVRALAQGQRSKSTVSF